MEEIWKDIKGYEGYYQVSNLGNVRSLERSVNRSDGKRHVRKERIMSKRMSTDGYYIAKFNVDKVSKCIAIHRLVAEAFIPNPDNLPEVNHKDFNRINNKVDNLEWCTHADNVKYSNAAGRHVSLSGKDNPNYHNDTLKKKYQEHPELKQCCARKREANGRCRKIELYDENMNYIKTFDWIGGCAEYIINQGWTKAKVDSIRGNILVSIRNNHKYLKHYFKFVESEGM